MKFPNGISMLKNIDVPGGTQIMKKINTLMAHFKTADIIESEYDSNIFVVKGKE